MEVCLDMRREILLYSSVYSWSAADVITRLEEARNEDATLRVNSPGGEVVSWYGVYAKILERKDKDTLVKVDGRADSGAAYLLCYVSNAECLDVSTFIFHRAAWPEWIESNPEYFTAEIRASLETMNGKLRAAIEGKVTAEEWEKVTGVSLDDLFSLDQRIDVKLDAKQAKKLGLVNKIVAITPERKAEIEAHVMSIAATSVPTAPAATTAQTKPAPQQQPKISKTMTILELQQQHPEVYASAVSAGVTQERDRVCAHLAFVTIDAEAVVKGIKAGEPLSQTALAEFTMKAISKQQLGNITADSAAATTTPETTTTTPEATAEQKAETAFTEDVTRQALASLGIQMPAAK